METTKKEQEGAREGNGACWGVITKKGVERRDLRVVREEGRAPDLRSTHHQLDASGL